MIHIHFASIYRVYILAFCMSFASMSGIEPEDCRSRTHAGKRSALQLSFLSVTGTPLPQLLRHLDCLFSLGMQRAFAGTLFSVQQ